MMLIEVNKDNWSEILTIVQLRKKSLYNTIKDIEATKGNGEDTLTTARAIKTQRVKQSIKEEIRSLLDAGIKPSKYLINKKTNISYPTLKKYYDEIEEIENER